MNSVYLFYVLLIGLEIFMRIVSAIINVKMYMVNSSLVEFQTHDIFQLNKKFSQTIYPQFPTAIIKFDNNLVLNETIDFRNQPSGLGQLELHIWYLKGFVISRSALPLALFFNSADYLVTINLNDSFFRFFDKFKRRLDTSCESFLASYFDLDIDDIIKNRVNKTQLFIEIEHSLFSLNLDILAFMTGVVLDGLICPLLFKNSFLHNFVVIGSQENRLIYRSLEFRDLKDTFGDTETLNLHTDILKYSISNIYRSEFCSRNFNKLVFKNTVSIKLIGVIGKIVDSDTFALINLKELVLIFSNTREFLHMSDNKWMSQLNYESRSLKLADFSDEYDMVDYYYKHKFEFKIQIEKT